MRACDRQAHDRPKNGPSGYPKRPPNTVDLGNGIVEHAGWADGGYIERVLGVDLSAASIPLPPGKARRHGRRSVRAAQPLAGIVETDRSFRSLVDGTAALEGLATAAVRQSER
jgi:hypothetical protein